jgi:HlyD family secretion protein
MTNTNSKKKSRLWIIVLLAVVAAGFVGYKIWDAKRNALPKGIASGNGRVEAKLIDVAAKEPLRVKEILVKEGDTVKPGDVVVRLDTSTLEAELAQARASVATAQEQIASAAATISRMKSEVQLAKTEEARARKLVEQKAGSQREYDVRKMAVETSQAKLAEAEAGLESAKQKVEVAKANEATVQTRINDATLVAPALGRVLYRLAEPGEVLAAGGKALTIVNLEDVYMEIFLPAQQAAGIKVGADARITVDNQPGRAVAARVTFVSPEAQFTPKQVETKSEREKLMFRVKIQVPPELVTQYIQSIKTGVRGVGYVKLSDSAAWPAALDKGLLTVDETGPVPTPAPTESTATSAAPESTKTAK